jgi:hypothetical protein
VLARFPGAQIVNVVERAKPEGMGEGSESDAGTGILGDADAALDPEAGDDNDLE